LYSIGQLGATKGKPFYEDEDASTLSIDLTKPTLTATFVRNGVPTPVYQFFNLG